MSCQSPTMFYNVPNQVYKNRADAFGLYFFKIFRFCFKKEEAVGETPPKWGGAWDSQNTPLFLGTPYFRATMSRVQRIQITP